MPKANNPKSPNHDDSSDEEDIKQKNQARYLNGGKVNVQLLAEELDVEKGQVIKSVLLHNIGRMVIFSPNIEKKYRPYKAKLLTERRILEEQEKGGINTENLGIKVEGLEDILVWGRLSRRSQVRSHRDIMPPPRDERGRRMYETEKRVTAQVSISSRKRKRVVVEENMVVNDSGLGGRSFPSTDMVNLRGESKKGAYESAYKDNRNNYGQNGVDQLVEAGKQAAEEQKSDELGGAIKTITELRGLIAQHYPQADQDIFIADSIRKVCRSEPLNAIASTNNIANQIYALTYLLFKTEVYRSPAALVNNIQMLDLIINGEMSLDDAFVKQQMPMSPKDAIRAARDLGEVYNRKSSNLFYKYENPYSYAPGYTVAYTPQNLIKKEAWLMDKWLTFKLGKKRFNAINADLKLHLPEIYREIYGALQGFGLNIQSRAFTRAMEDLPSEPVVETIDFIEEGQLGNKVMDDLDKISESVSKIDNEALIKKHNERLERCLTDDERLVCLQMECEGNNLTFHKNFDSGVVKINARSQIKAICPIQSISTDHENYLDTIKDFIDEQQDRRYGRDWDTVGKRIIFSLHGNNHYKTLVVDPAIKKYRYIDPMHDSENGEIEDETLRKEFAAMGYGPCVIGYVKQQHSENMSKETGGALAHNNECAFHSVFTTIRIARNGINSDLSNMNKYGMKMRGEDCATLTPEFAKDTLRPFYEEVFQVLRKEITESRVDEIHLSGLVISDERTNPNSSPTQQKAQGLSGDKAKESGGRD